MTHARTSPASRQRQEHIHIGTSGWTYEQWRFGLYAGIPRSRWLSHYAHHFNAVEVNATFYHQLKPATFAGWRDGTPDSFRFTIKANRYLTHVKQLQFDDQALQRERSRAQPLGRKLTAVLWQMPAGLHFHPDLLEAFAARLEGWGETRHVLEFRHDSWFIPETAGLLARHRLAVCQSDAADWPMWDAVTTDVVYVRLHGHRVTYSSPYSEEELEGWARRMRTWCGEGREVHVYFDNTDAGHAPRNAMRLAALAGVSQTKQEDVCRPS